MRGMAIFARCGSTQSVDRDGNPIPWYTYPAIGYSKTIGQGVYAFNRRVTSHSLRAEESKRKKHGFSSRL